MSENWNAYITQIEDSIASVLLDMGIASDAPDPQRTMLLRIFIPLQDPDEYGMTSNEEFEAIQPLEEGIVDALEQGIDAVHVGCLTHDGQREVAFYCSSVDGVGPALAPVVQQHPSYQLKSSHQDDADWGFYFEILYPSLYEFQSMQNASVLHNLMEAGDSLEKERPVSHWLYFPSEQARAQFISSVQEKDFQIEQESLGEDADDPTPFGVQIERVDHVDQASIDQVTIELLELARTLDGTYDGWETMVVTEE